MWSNCTTLLVQHYYFLPRRLCSCSTRRCTNNVVQFDPSIITFCTSVSSRYNFFALLHETETGTASDRNTMNFVRKDGSSLQIMYRKRFQTAYHYIRLNSKCQEALFKFFCSKVGSVCEKVY